MLLKKVVIMGALLGLGGAAQANEVQLLNMSEQQAPLEVDFQVVRATPGKPVLYGAVQHVVLQDSFVVGFDPEGYTLSGIVPVRVNGHALPEDVRAFPPRLDTCSVATTSVQPEGKLFLTMVKQADGHGSLTCSKESGYLQP